MHRSPAGSVVRLPNLSRNNRRSSSKTFISLYTFYRNLLPPRDIRFPRRPATGQSRLALSPWLPPSSYGRGGKSGYIYHQAATEGAAPPAQRLAPRSESCQLRGTFVLTGSGTGGRRGNSVQLQETYFACSTRKAQARHRRQTDRPEASAVVLGWDCTRACAPPRLAYPPPRRRPHQR
jgi:hypothetical protein